MICADEVRWEIISAFGEIHEMVLHAKVISVGGAGSAIHREGARVGTVGLKDSGFRGVGQIWRENRTINFAAEGSVFQAEHNFDTFVNKIGRAHV